VLAPRVLTNNKATPDIDLKPNQTETKYELRKSKFALITKTPRHPSAAREEFRTNIVFNVSNSKKKRPRSRANVLLYF